MKRYNDLLQFVSKNYGGFVFIGMFYSVWAIFRYTGAYYPELHSFPGRMIGQATLQAYDIQQRVSDFYSCGFIFFVGLLITAILAWRISIFSNNFFKTPETRIINYSSLAGIVFFFFSIWGFDSKPSLELVYIIQKTALVGWVLRKTLFKNFANINLIAVPFYSLAFVTGFSLYFFLSEVGVLFHWFAKVDLHLIIFAFTTLFLMGIIYSVNNKNAFEAPAQLNRLGYLLLPISLLPILSVLKDETYMILNGHQVYYLTPKKLYLIGLLALAGWGFMRYRQLKKPLIPLSLTKQISNCYFPLLIAGVTLFAYYSPTIEASTELFESGNYILPLMEFKKFGVLPIIEKFNAHLLSELFFSSIYVLFNGLKGHEVFIYNFFFTLLWALLAYWFLLKFLRNPYMALFLVVLFPLTESLLSEYHITALLGIFVIHKNTEERPSFTNYFLLLSCIAFLLLWRLDIGYPAAIALTGTLLIHWLNQRKFKPDVKLLFKVIATYSIAATIVLGGIALYRHFNILQSVLFTLNYLSSAQSYGYVSLGDTNIPAIAMQYYVFPILLLLLFSAFVVLQKKLTITRSQRFVFTTLIFLSIYYFGNFQRGVVAHTLYGGVDIWLSPFLFFLIPASIYVFFRKKDGVGKFLLFISIATLLVFNYKLPNIKAQETAYLKFASKTQHFPSIEPKENIERCINDMQFENRKFGHFKQFINEHLTEEQTFIDFSNTPMLYYLTEKISPSHFYQNPLTIHNDFLQNAFIEGLKDYDTPLLVFSHFPETWWDNAIGVPNTLRHYKMAEYFYQNYEPFAMIDSLCLWKKKGLAFENNERTVYSYSYTNDSLNSHNIISGGLVNTENKNYVFELNSNGLITEKEEAPMIHITPESETGKISSYYNTHTHRINYTYHSKLSSFSFSTDNTQKKIKQLKIREVEHLPELVSSKPRYTYIDQLAYIWATYDKTIHEQEVIQNLLSAPIELNQEARYFFFPDTIDKTTGNMILLSLNCENINPFKIEIFYGNSKSDYKGSFEFTVPAGKGQREFAIRISSHYLWYDGNVDFFAIYKKENISVALNGVKLLKGN